jgi:hypothetical protein
MARFNVPAQPKPRAYEIENFLGVDLTNAPNSVAVNRSPEAPNMIRDTVGKIKKRDGVSFVKNYSTKGSCTYQITTNAVDGDKVYIYDQTFTAVSATPTNKQFLVGLTIDATAANLAQAIEDAVDPGDELIFEDFDVTVSTDTITITEKVSKGRTPSGAGTEGDIVIVSGTPVVSKVTGINGVHSLPHSPSMRKIIHAGTMMYSDEATPTALYSTAADNFSVSEVMNESLWILDGKAFLEYDGETCAPVVGYTPTIIIGRAPKGGGTLLEEINLIQDAKIVKFLGTGYDRRYYLPHTDIAAVTLVQVMDSSGVMQTVSPADYDVDLTAGTVLFGTTKAPGESPITGEDNVYITYTKSITGYADRINKCDICTRYGMGGARDRLFVSGNPDYPHYDWFSAQNDPTYFGDLSYCIVGHASSAIMGYSIVNDYLVTHKTREKNDENASLRAGELIGGKAVFTIQGSYPASGALSKHSFAELGVEPVYLTVKKDISAITPSDILGERYSQERSYYISEALKAESDADLSNAFGYTFNDFYYLSVGSKVYIMDSLQFSVDKNKPYSSRQYECYYFTGINARVMWQEDGYLYFGDVDGNIKKFDPEVANDEGVAIQAYWDTPELDGDSFAYKKTFTYIAVRIASAPATGIRISSRVRGIWDEGGAIKDYTAEAMYFDFTKLDFAALSFSTDDTPRTIGTKMKIKNVDKVQFRLQNNVLDQPFGIYKLRIEYFESGRYAK